MSTFDPSRIGFLTSSRFGQGNPRLGESLMEDFLKTLSGNPARLTTLLLANSAVVLACSDSPLCPLIQKLEEEGMEILVNQESLAFYSLEAKMEAGQTIDAAGMTERLIKADQVITF